MAAHPGKLLFTLPAGYRPRYWTYFPLGDDPVEGGIVVHQDGEIRFITPHDSADEEK